MSAPLSRRPAALLLAAGLAGGAPAAQALNIVFNDVGSSAMSREQFSAFESAAAFWQARLTDPVTIYINIGFDNLGTTTLGTTTWAQREVGYGELRSLLTADATSAVDASAVAHLQPGGSLTFIATQANLSTRLDRDGSANNSRLKLTTANAKALGLNATTSIANPDATIRFSSSYASGFDYSRASGLAFDQIDFGSLAEHEIGHALGFVSGVDSIDACISQATHCGAIRGLEGRAWYTALDLFRYSAPGTLNLSVGAGAQPYFSVDGGETALQSFATGRNHGDGTQASHFKDGGGSLMAPHMAYGQAYDAADADLMALDAIGWDVSAAPVPEPGTYAMLLSGLAVLAWAARRRG